MTGNSDLRAFISKEIAIKERAYNSGCLGALGDVVEFCNRMDVPLPDWAAKEVLRSLAMLAEGNTKPWKSWWRRYKKDMKDYEVYEEMGRAREQGAEWKDIYDITASIVDNRITETRTEGVKKAYKRTKKRMEEEPYRYHLLRTFKPKEIPRQSSPQLWCWIGRVIESGNPKKVDKSDLG